MSDVDRLIDQIAATFDDSSGNIPRLAFGHGAADARTEAELLVLGMLHKQGTQEMDTALASEIAQLAQRRVNERLPTAYLTGEAWFGGRWFEVKPGVMIPRSPIFELIDTEFQPWLANRPARILDMCCGTGCLGISAALAFDSAELVLVDIDPLAVGCARANVARHGLGSRAQIVQADLFDGLDGVPFDLVIANPPYVPQAEFRSLPAEFVHEPETGLTAGDDGLAVWRRIVADVPAHLTRGGLLVGESGSVSGAFRDTFTHIETIWPELRYARRLEDGSFGVFVADAATVLR